MTVGSSHGVTHEGQPLLRKLIGLLDRESPQEGTLTWWWELLGLAVERARTRVCELREPALADHIRRWPSRNC